MLKNFPVHKKKHVYIVHYILQDYIFKVACQRGLIRSPFINEIDVSDINPIHDTASCY